MPMALSTKRWRIFLGEKIKRTSDLVYHRDRIVNQENYAYMVGRACFLSGHRWCGEINRRITPSKFHSLVDERGNFKRNLIFQANTSCLLISSFFLQTIPMFLLSLQSGKTNSDAQRRKKILYSVYTKF